MPHFQSNLSQIEEKCFQTIDGIKIERESRICIYNGKLNKDHNILDADAAITTGEVFSYLFLVIF